MRYLFGILILVSFIISGCGSSTPTPDVDATIAAGIAATQVAQPTDTPTPEPTNTPEPTETPIPTDTPTPTNTPEPTDTPTSFPTDTPTIEVSPVDGYGLEIGNKMSSMGEALSELSTLLLEPKILDDNWRLQVATWAATIQLIHEDVLAMEPPPEVSHIHEEVLSATGDCNDSMDHLLAGLDNLDVDEMTTASELLLSCGTKSAELSTRIQEAGSLETLAALPTPTPSPIPATATSVPPTSTPVPPTPLPKTNDLGVAKTVGNWQMSLYDVKRAKTVYFFGDPKTAQGVWLIPFVEFTNLSPGTLAPYNDLDFYLQREDGSTISVGYNDGTAGAAWQFQAGDFLDDIQPGQLIGVALAEDVPQDLSDVWLRVEQDPNFAIYLGNASSIPLEE